MLFCCHYHSLLCSTTDHCHSRSAEASDHLLRTTSCWTCHGCNAVLSVKPGAVRSFFSVLPCWKQQQQQQQQQWQKGWVDWRNHGNLQNITARNNLFFFSVFHWVTLLFCHRRILKTSSLKGAMQVFGKHCFPVDCSNFSHVAALKVT